MALIALGAVAASAHARQAAVLAPPFSYTSSEAPNFASADGTLRASVVNGQPFSKAWSWAEAGGHPEIGGAQPRSRSVSASFRIEQVILGPKGDAYLALIVPPDYLFFGHFIACPTAVTAADEGQTVTVHCDIAMKSGDLIAGVLQVGAVGPDPNDPTPGASHAEAVLQEIRVE